MTAVVPIMIAGMHGLNFGTMPGLRWNLGYSIVLTASAFIVAVMYQVFKRSGWL